MTFSSWILCLLGDQSILEGRERLVPFRRLLFIHGAVRSLSLAPLFPAVHPAGGILLLGCLASSWKRPDDARITRFAFLVLLLEVYESFPSTNNHTYLELLLFLALAAVGSGKDVVLGVAALRGVAVVVLFSSGVQKFLHGLYFSGDFLAYMISVSPEFAEAYSLVVPNEEIARLQAYSPTVMGSGPYRIDSALFVCISNAVLAAEILLPISLMIPRIRRPAAILAIVFFSCIVIATREVLFAILFTNLIMLFLGHTVIRKWFPLSALLYAYLLAVILNLAPGKTLLRYEHL